MSISIFSRNRLRAIAAGFALLGSAVSCAAQAGEVTDFLHIPGPLNLSGKGYHLAWSAHPQPGYYKHEYLPAGDSLPRYHSMMIVEFIRGKSEVALLVADMIGELKKRQESNANIRYEVLQKGEEYLIDFLLTENSADGSKITMAERNVYRYRLSTDGKGAKGIQLFGISKRGYGPEVEAFFAEIKAGRETLIGEVGGADIPVLSL